MIDTKVVDDIQNYEIRLKCSMKIENIIIFCQLKFTSLLFNILKILNIYFVIHYIRFV